MKITQRVEFQFYAHHIPRALEEATRQVSELVRMLDYEVHSEPDDRVKLEAMLATANGCNHQLMRLKEQLEESYIG